MDIQLTPFDPADYLGDAESQLALINDALDSGDGRYLSHALGVIARARGGMLSLERSTGIKRQTLHKSLSSEGNPTLETIMPVLKALNLKMRIEEMA